MEWAFEAFPEVGGGFMSKTARLRFVHFTGEEIDAIYDYLAARGRKMTGMDATAER